MKLVLTVNFANSSKEGNHFFKSLLSGSRFFESFTVMLLRILFPGKWT